MYRQYDGYPEGHGLELAQFLTRGQLVSGLSGKEEVVFNGMGCLAAAMVSNFKETPGGFYIHSVEDTECGQDYEYHVYQREDDKFTYPEIKQELLEMVEYMDREGWEILNMEFTHIAAGPLYCKLDGDKLVNMSGEEIDYQFDQLIVKFVEKDIKTNESTEEDIHREMMIKKYGLEALEECDSIISNVKDMLLELELDGLEIFTSINYTPLTLMGIEKTPKLFLNIKCGSKLWDSNESLIDGVISTIKEFVGSYGYVVGTNFRKEEKRQVTIPIIDIYEVEYQMLIQK
jgi:hypothetical protein